MKVVILVVYIDDIVVAGNDDDEIKKLKAYLQTKLKLRIWEISNTFLELRLQDLRVASSSHSASTPWISLKKQGNYVPS